MKLVIQKRLLKQPEAMKIAKTIQQPSKAISQSPNTELDSRGFLIVGLFDTSPQVMSWWQDRFTGWYQKP